MTPVEMKFHLNLNGDTFQTFVDHSYALNDALGALRKALGNMRPHGRNYQTLGGDYSEYNSDRKLNVEAWEAVNRLEAYYDAHVHQLVKQEGSAR